MTEVEVHPSSNRRLDGSAVLFSGSPLTAEIQAAAEVAGVRLVTLAKIIEPLLLAARHQRRWELDNPQPLEIEF